MEVLAVPGTIDPREPRAQEARAAGDDDAHWEEPQAGQARYDSSPRCPQAVRRFPFSHARIMSTSAPPQKLLVALRKSALSLCHAEYIRAGLLGLYPQCDIVLRGITTQGDRIIDQPLQDFGGKGLFIREIENAMTEGRADFAVHSLKDMPTDL